MTPNELANIFEDLVLVTCKGGKTLETVSALVEIGEAGRRTGLLSVLHGGLVHLGNTERDRRCQQPATDAPEERIAAPALLVFELLPLDVLLR